MELPFAEVGSGLWMPSPLGFLHKKLLRLYRGHRELGTGQEPDPNSPIPAKILPRWFRGQESIGSERGAACVPEHDIKLMEDWPEQTLRYAFL